MHEKVHNRNITQNALKLWENLVQFSLFLYSLGEQ